MSNRRNFIKGGVLGAVGTAIFPKLISAIAQNSNPNSEEGHPMVISTWKHGMPANVAAMEVLQSGGKAIDAVEAGVFEMAMEMEMEMVTMQFEEVSQLTRY